MDELLDLDRTLLLSWNGSDSLFLDGFMWMYSNMWMWFPMAFCLLLLIVRNNDTSRYLTIFLLIGLLVTASDQLSSGLLKPLVERFRPTHEPAIASLIDTVREYRGGTYGFPSSHAANSFALFVFSALLIRHWGYTLAMFLWASITGYSRIYLGVHYPGDVLCGAILGALLGFLFYSIYLYLTNRGTDRYNHKNTYHSKYSQQTNTCSGYSISQIHLYIVVFLLSNIAAMGIGLFVISNP